MDQKEGIVREPKCLTGHETCKLEIKNFIYI